MHVCVCVRACTHPSSAACWFQEECWWQNRGTHCFWRLCQSPLPISLILHKETGKNTPGQAEHSQGDLGSPPRAVCAGRGNDPSLSHLVERPARSGEKLNTRWGIPAQTAWPLFLILCINWAWQWSWMWRKKKRLAWSTEKSELRSWLFRSLLSNASCPHLENFSAC